MNAVGNRILVEVQKNDTCIQKIGSMSITISENGADYDSAIIISVGPEVTDETLKAGDKVYIYPHAGKAVRDPETNAEYKVIAINEIIVKL